MNAGPWQTSCTPKAYSKSAGLTALCSCNVKVVGVVMYGGETELEAPGCRGDNPALLSRMTNATWEWAKTVWTQVSGGCIVLISVARAPLYVGCSKKYA